MMPTISKELVDSMQSACEAFLFQTQDVEKLMLQMSQLIYVSELLLDHPELVREANFIDNLISAYEIKANRLDPTYEF